MMNGTTLRALRALRRLSQAELAAKAGVTQTAIAQFERGQREIRTNTLRGLPSALGASVIFTIDGTEVRSV